MTAPPLVVVLDLIDEPSVELRVLGDVARVELLHAVDERDLLRQPERLRDAVGLVAYHHCRIGAELLDLMPHLKVIGRAGAGYDNVNLADCTARNIHVCVVPDYGVEEVADSALALLLNLMRRTHHCATAVTAGSWPTLAARQAIRLRGKTLGLVGFGLIGKAVAVRAKAFGLDVAYYDPYTADGLDKALGVRRVNTLAQLLAGSDIVSLHCLLNAETRHIINAEALSHWKRGAILINTARGGLIDEAALVPALQSGLVGAAGVDVLEREPSAPHMSAKDFSALATLDNVIITPHSAFCSAEAFEELRAKAALHVRRHLTGEPLRNVVNPH